MSKMLAMVASTLPVLVIEKDIIVGISGINPKLPLICKLGRLSLCLKYRLRPATTNASTAVPAVTASVQVT